MACFSHYSVLLATLWFSYLAMRLFLKNKKSLPYISKLKLKPWNTFFQSVEFLFLWLNIALSWSGHLNKLGKGKASQGELKTGLTFSKGHCIHWTAWWIWGLLWLHGQVFFFFFLNWDIIGVSKVFIKKTEDCQFPLVQLELPLSISKSKFGFMTSCTTKPWLLFASEGDLSFQKAFGKLTICKE